MTADSEFVFAASSVGEPWWWLGELTRQVLSDDGFTVDVRSEAGSFRNPRWVGGGDALIGGSQAETVLAAQHRRGPYVDDELAEFRAIARVDRPCWLGVAATASSGITSLDQVRSGRLPVRIVAPQWTAVGSEVCLTILRHYNLEPSDIEEFGGRFHHVHGYAEPFVREGDYDILMGNIYLGNTPGMRYWNEASVLTRLRFLPLPDELRQAIAAETGHELAMMPQKILRGVETDYPTVRRGDLLVYGREDLDEEFAYLLARRYDENGHWFFDHAAVHMGLNPTTSWRTPIPLHPGAERYYRERGYMS